LFTYQPIIQHLKTNNDFHLDILRLDLIDSEISGNKWFKLKYSLEKARKNNFDTIITFGGAFSNHLAATAAACKKFNFKSIGIIRGREIDLSTNSTLLKAKADGMRLHFVAREFYAQKKDQILRDYLHENFGAHFLIPEGGNNKEGVLGCTEILDGLIYDYSVCACGTGTTYAGLAASVKQNHKVIGVNVLKGENNLVKETAELLSKIFPGKKISLCGNEELQKTNIENHCITNSYCFSGYAKYDKDLIDFKKEFEAKYSLPLDYVYTNKAMYAVFDMMKKSLFKPGARILFIHTGGLQGNKGFEERYHLTPNL
jgi:1-aminocyclopropane-1-carboxylate deaminase